jgi:CheY-like chemotaxis protein
MLGFGQPEAVVGREILGFIEASHRDAALQEALAEPGRPLRTRGLRADGTAFGIEVSSRRIQHRTGVARLFFVRDISPLSMVVDDDNLVKNLIAALMRISGYQTCTYSHPQRAVQTFEPGLVSVLVTDVQMPGMDGVSFVAELRKRDPELPVIFVSGFTVHPVQKEDEKTRFVPKPFGVEDLKRALERLPDRARRDLP